MQADINDITAFESSTQPSLSKMNSKKLTAFLIDGYTMAELLAMPSVVGIIVMPMKRSLEITKIFRFVFNDLSICSFVVIFCFVFDYLKEIFMIRSYPSS